MKIWPWLLAGGALLAVGIGVAGMMGEKEPESEADDETEPATRTLSEPAGSVPSFEEDQDDETEPATRTLSEPAGSVPSFEEGQDEDIGEED